MNKFLLEDQVLQIADNYVARHHPSYSTTPATINLFSTENNDEAKLAKELCAKFGIDNNPLSQPHYVVAYGEKDPLVLHIDAYSGEVLNCLKRA